LSGFQEVNEKTSANQFEFCRCRSVIGERNPTNFAQLEPTHPCSKCTVKYMSLDPFMKHGKQLLMCIYCRNKKKEWRAKRRKADIA
jgi:hypothetical protein